MRVLLSERTALVQEERLRIQKVRVLQSERDLQGSEQNKGPTLGLPIKRSFRADSMVYEIIWWHPAARVFVCSSTSLAVTVDAELD